MSNNLSAYHYIKDQPGLHQLCAQLADAQVLALDTEFIREKTYFPRLCLLQIATEDLVACIDPLQVDDMHPLLEILYDKDKLKVLHAARQDLEIFYHLRQTLPAPVFDTQIAATLLGHGDQTGYSTLVKEMLGVELDKAHTRTDWSQRPLDDSQLHYAADDVRYLIRLYPLLRDELKRLGRLGWLEKDFQSLVDPVLYTINPDKLWQRISGHNKLKGRQLAILQRLALWREERAHQQDKPRRWILSDDILLSLARQIPGNLAELEKIRGLSSAQVNKLGKQLLSNISEAKGLPKEKWPTLPGYRRPDKTQEALTDALMAILRIRALDAGISASALANRKEIDRLVMGERDIPLAHGWRAEIAGNAMLDFLQGGKSLLVRQQHLVISDAN